MKTIYAIFALFLFGHQSYAQDRVTGRNFAIRSKLIAHQGMISDYIF
jgi:hypothetical protein